MAHHTDDEWIGNHGLCRRSPHLIVTTTISNNDGHGETFSRALILNSHLEHILFCLTNPTQWSRKVSYQADVDRVARRDDNLAPGIGRDGCAFRRARAWR